MNRLFARLAGALLLVAASMAWADRPQLIVPFIGSGVRLADRPFASEGSPVRFNSGEMLSLRYRDEVEVRLPNATAHTFVFELAQAHGDGIHSWIGVHKERGNLHRVIVTTGPSGSFGVISTPDGDYRLVPGSGHDWLIDVAAEQLHMPITDLRDDSRIPPASAKRRPEESHAPSTFVAIPGVNSLAVGKVTPVPQVLVDLMFVYTRGLADNLGANLMTRLYFLVTRANTAYADSEVAITLRLVNAVMVDFPDSGGNDVALDSITPVCTVAACGNDFNAAVFGNIESLRTSYGADVVALMRNGSNFGGSGLAWVGSTSATSQFMYSVTTGCVQGCESVFIHEVGHNMGNRHDRPTSAWQAGGTPSYGQGAFTYSFGYAYCESAALTCNPELPPASGGCASGSQPECSASHGNNFSEIMAYFHGTTLRNYKFSNPNVMCAGSGPGVPIACGVSEGAANSANTALSMNNNRMALSAIKAQVVGADLPGSLQFTALAFTAVESAGTMAFTVSRIGGSAGMVQVSYATANGTAQAGSDYTATSGTLSWAAGDTANKIISVAIANDGVAESGEAFSVILSNPSGTAGVFIGSPSTATGLIIEAWPPAGAMPPGFVMPSGSSAAWTVATDQVFEGTHSLRSGTVFGSFSPTTSYTPSHLEFTGDFLAGTLGFAYRVSSYQNLGHFDFSVDGAVVLSATGESGWIFFTRAITAGTHTLRWTFRNAMPSACNTGWSPAAVGGSACADRAWIDALVLPLAQPSMTLTVSKSGSGSGTVTASPAGINCGATCTAPFNFGTSVALSAVASTGSTFAGWGGACSGTGSCVVTMDATKAVTAAFDLVVPLSPVAQLVTSYYNSILGRAPDAPGLEFWTNEANRVVALGADVREVFFALSIDFFNSQEYRNRNTSNSQYLTDLYRTFFSRVPDSAGLQFWTDNLAAGMDRGAVLGSFLFSTEFSNTMTGIFGVSSPRPEINVTIDLYRGILGRLPDSAGFNFWLGRIRAAQCRTTGAAAAVTAEVNGLSQQFIGSAEYGNIWNARILAERVPRFMGDVYNAIMRRGPDLAGYQFYVNQINTGGKTSDQVRAEFVQSPEFQARVGEVVAVGCIP